MSAVRDVAVCAVIGMMWLVLLSTGFSRADEPKANQAKSPAKEAQKPLFTLSKETTYVTGPLRKDGSVDYVAALNVQMSRGVTAENNAAVLLHQVVGPGDVLPEFRAEYFKRLGITPLPVEGNYFVTLDQLVQRAVVGKAVSEKQFAELDPQVRRRVFAAQEKVWQQFEQARGKPWKAREFPLLAEWLLVNQEPLELVQQACQRPRYYSPMMSDDKEPFSMVSVLLPGLSRYRDVTRALAIRITMNLALGKIDDVIADSITCHRLGRLLGQGWSLIDSLVGVAIDSIACQADVVVAHHGKLMPEQINKWRQQLKGLTAFPPMVDRIDLGERFTYLDATLSMVRFGPSALNELDGGGGDVAKGSFKEVFSKVMFNMLTDWDDVLRRGNRWYDELAVAGRKPTYQQRIKAFAEIERKLDKQVAATKDLKTFLGALLTRGKGPGTVVSSLISDILAAMLLPAVDKALLAEDRMVMNNRLVEVALGLNAYRQETGQYPVQLEQLVPKHLARIPEDLFVGKPVRYRRRAGGFLLYSVGPNQKDDRGQRKGGELDDVGFQLPVPPQDAE